MARRSRAAPAPRRTASPIRAQPAPARAAPAPAPAPAAAAAPQQQTAPVPQQQPAAMQPQQQGPGMVGQIMANAASIGIGHVVAHKAIDMMSGGSDKQEQQPVAAQAPQQAYQQPQIAQQGGSNPCQYEMEQFMQCANQAAGDLNFCANFNEALRQCKVRNGELH
eukprot:Nk52_evm81s485 gene=Nk52_evmTU81s485